MIQDPTRRLAPVVRIAPAKLNLTLAVVGRRDNGFHELHSIMVPLGLADVLSLATTTAATDTLHVEGFDPGPSEDNLVLRAIAAAREAVGAGWASGGAPAGPSAGPAPRLAARLDKRIPVAAGLAGGSSDAAAAIGGAVELWGAELDAATRRLVGARIGSDVPFFAAGGAALVEGRGERVTALGRITGTPLGVLLVTPAVRLATGDVYAAYDAGARPADPGAARAASVHLASELASGLSGARLYERAGVLASANDLIPAAASLLPALIPFRRSLTRLLGRPVGQSGSGPTAWALYPSLTTAEEARTAVLAALQEGRLVGPGEAQPNVVATTIVQEGPA